MFAWIQNYKLTIVIFLITEVIYWNDTQSSFNPNQISVAQEFLRNEETEINEIEMHESRRTNDSGKIRMPLSH